MPKTFRLKPSQIELLAHGYGSCLASDQITVEGKPVGYMYRESADTADDSGWRFFSGMESQDYADDPDNFAIYDVNTIANYDRSVVPFLDAPVGSAFARGEDGLFHPESMPQEPDAH